MLLRLPEDVPELGRFQRVIREDRFQVPCTHVLLRHFSEYVAEIGGDGEIAALVELVVAETFPLTVNLAALDGIPEHEHRVPVAEVGTERGDRLREGTEEVR